MSKKKCHELFYGITCNADQEKFKQAILSDENQVVIAEATAGAGKTLIAVACAGQSEFLLDPMMIVKLSSADVWHRLIFPSVTPVSSS